MKTAPKQRICGSPNSRCLHLRVRQPLPSLPAGWPRDISPSTPTVGRCSLPQPWRDTSARGCSRAERTLHVDPRSGLLETCALQTLEIKRQEHVGQRIHLLRLLLEGSAYPLRESRSSLLRSAGDGGEKARPRRDAHPKVHGATVQRSVDRLR